jgi:hypothetical protein
MYKIPMPYIPCEDPNPRSCVENAETLTTTCYLSCHHSKCLIVNEWPAGTSLNGFQAYISAYVVHIYRTICTYVATIGAYKGDSIISLGSMFPPIHVAFLKKLTLGGVV